MAKINQIRSPLLVAGSIVGLVVLILGLFVIDECFFQKETPGLENKTIRESLEKTSISYEVYKQWVIRQNIKTYEWHLRSTKIIFWLSMIVAMSGIGFAFWQFVEASKDTQKALLSEELELKTQLASLAFKARSIAALIMFVSIVYILIYAIFIYPIHSNNQIPFPITQNNTCIEDNNSCVKGDIPSDDNNFEKINNN